MEPTTPFLVSAKPHATVRGFSLVEMMVVLAIIVIITTVAVTGQSTFNQTLLLTDTAYTVAFSVRQAQSFGLSSRTFGTTPNTGYGVHFNRVTPGGYVLFADTMRTAGMAPGCPTGTAGTPEAKPGNCLYDAGTDGIVDNYSFSRGFSISSFCGTLASGGARMCSTDSSPLTSLNAVFLRPNTISLITGLRGTQAFTFSCAEVLVAAPTGGTSKTVRISGLGEVSVGQVCP